ncbi:MAG: hypothetical protein J6W00_00230, partial [Lentisphaeria bacterium]|nr:hypothetical protein [Lentisphaeria bacterium]
MANENTATIIIRRPYDIMIGVTNTNLYDIILLPQADGVEDGGRVITVYNGYWDRMVSSDSEKENGGDVGGPSGSDSHDVFSLTLGKNDAYLAIGGNYYDNNETYCMVTAISADSRDGNLPQDNAHPGPGPGALVLYDENGNPVETPYTYMVDANYNVHHLAYSVADKENGAIRFSGDKGTLVLTAQNGAKNSAEYTESKYNKYYDVSIDLSEFANVNAGDTFCYSVDGGEIKTLTVGADKKVVISDTEINANANVDWYVAGSRENRLSENEKFDIVSYAESLAGGMIGNMFGSSNADRINFISALKGINNSGYADYANPAGGLFDLSALDEANYMWLKINGDNGGEWQKLAVENGAVYIEGHQFSVSDTFEWYFVFESNEVLTDTYTIAGIDAGLDISLSAFDRNL